MLHQNTKKRQKPLNAIAFRRKEKPTKTCSIKWITWLPIFILLNNSGAYFSPLVNCTCNLYYKYKSQVQVQLQVKKHTISLFSDCLTFLYYKEVDLYYRLQTCNLYYKFSTCTCTCNLYFFLYKIYNS